jgi:hypothetical protein
LGDTEHCPAHDDEPRQALEWGEALVLGLNLDIVERCADVVSDSSPNRALTIVVLGLAWHRRAHGKQG